MVSKVEICVVGGGPAGSTIAHKLALLGHKVCLIEKANFPRAHIGESLPPNIFPLLKEFGLCEKIEQANFLRPKGAIVCWEQDKHYQQYPPQQRGFHVDRAIFDHLLLEAAKNAGVSIIHAQAFSPIQFSEGYKLPIKQNGVKSLIETKFIVDASGKSSFWPLTKKRYLAKTIALYAYWQDSSLAADIAYIEAGPAQWYWGAPLPQNLCNVVIFMDSKCCKGFNKKARQIYYELLLSKTKLLQDCLDGIMVGEVKTCDASSYRDETPIGMDFIKVGEASFSIDPLSSQGVSIAMGTALQGAVAVHTILTCPQNAPLALNFYRTKQNKTVIRCQRQTAQIYARQKTFGQEPFWRIRSQLPKTSKISPSATAFPIYSNTLLTLSPLAQIGATTIIKNNIVESAAALTHPSLEEPLVYLDDIDVVPLIKSISGAITLEEFLPFWSQKIGRLKSKNILLWLIKRGIICQA